MSGKKPSGVQLFVDSGAGIPKDILRDLDIHEIPLDVMIDGEAYHDGTIATSWVVACQKVGRKVTTSAPTTGDAMNALERIIRAGHNDIIVITVQGISSGTYGSLLQARKNLIQQYEDRPLRIKVIDGYNASMALGLLVIRVAELLKEGASYDEAVDFARNNRRNTLLLVALWESKYAAQGGRVDKKIGAYAASFLHLHPTVVVLPNVKPQSFGPRIPPRKMDDAITIIAGKAAQYWQPGARLAVMYVAGLKSKDRAKNLATVLSTRLGIDREEISISEAPAALSAHAGYDALGIALYRESRIRWKKSDHPASKVGRRLYRK